MSGAPHGAGWATCNQRRHELVRGAEASLAERVNVHRGTRRFNSSTQLSTTIICDGGGTYISFEIPVMNLHLPTQVTARIRSQISEVQPNLILILKLQAGKDWDKSAHEEPVWYFPPDDEIYQALVQADAPHVVRYKV